MNESLAMCKSHIEASVYILYKMVIYSNNDTNIRLTIDIKQKANRTKLESNKDKDSYRYQLISNNVVYKAQTYFDNNISYGLYSRYNLTSYSNFSNIFYSYLFLIIHWVKYFNHMFIFYFSIEILQTYFKQTIYTYIYVHILPIALSVDITLGICRLYQSVLFQ